MAHSTFVTFIMRTPAHFLSSMRLMRRVTVPLAMACACAVSSAATYPATGSQSFSYANGSVPGAGAWNDGSVLSSTAVGTPPVPVASIQANALRLAADGVPGTTASFKIPELDVGQDISCSTVDLRHTPNRIGILNSRVTMPMGFPVVTSGFCKAHSEVRARGSRTRTARPHRR